MRDTITASIRQAFENDPNVLALWEGGSASFGRADQYSDIDLQMMVKDDYVTPSAQKLEQVLLGISPIKDRYLIPQPSWHGHWQEFYRLRDADPLLLVDFVIMKESSTDLLTQPEIHGQPIIYFDRTGRVGKESMDKAKHQEMIKQRIARMEGITNMFHLFVDKEIKRGRPLDALSFYQSMMLGPLVESLRMLHDPNRYNFGPRYLVHYLPGDMHRKLEELFFVGSMEDIAGKKEKALEWLNENIAKLKKEYSV
jgi:hypothetical protein